MIITISGAPASGKSTVAVLLAQRLSIERIYMGSIFRDMAKECSMTLLAFYEQLDCNPDLEKATDAELAKRMLEVDSVIAEGRVAFLWKTPGKCRVDIFVNVDPDEGARRFFDAHRLDEQKFDTVDECRKYLADRVAIERKRYFGLYALEDHHDPRHFDFIPDSTGKTPEQIVDEIISFCKKRGLRVK